MVSPASYLVFLELLLSCLHRGQYLKGGEREGRGRGKGEGKGKREEEVEEEEMSGSGNRH